MSRIKTDVDALVDLPDDEFEERRASAAARVEERIRRASDERRDLTVRESDLTRADRDELAALQEAGAVREYRSRMGSEIQNLIDRQPSLETRGRLDEFVSALSRGVPARVQIECRSITTANAGARTGTAVQSLGRPQWLYEALGIPFAVSNTLKVAGPKFAALVARSATAEGANKPNATDPTLEEETLAAFAVVEDISDQVVRFGVGAGAVTNRLASESVFSVNAAIADSLEAAAGTPITYTTSAGHMADAGIAKIWARTGAKPTGILVNSADYPLLAAKAVTGPGDTVGAEVVRYNGIPIAVNDAVTAGIGVVVNGSAFSAHGTDVLLASAPNLSNNTVLLRAETYFALLQHDEGAIVAVDFAA